MLVLAPKEIKISSRSVLHLVHPQHVKNPEIVAGINAAKCQSKQIAYPGNSMITQDRVDTFSCIVIHPVAVKYLVDWQSRLSKMFEQLVPCLESMERELWFIGDSIRLISPSILYVPNGTNTTFNDQYTSADIIEDSNGLNLVPFYMDLHSQLMLRDPRYRRNIQYASSKYSPMYGMTDNCLIKGSKIAGNPLVIIQPDRISEYKSKTIDTTATKAPNKPTAMKFLYPEDFDSEGKLKQQKNQKEVEKLAQSSGSE